MRPAAEHCCSIKSSKGNNKCKKYEDKKLGYT